MNNNFSSPNLTNVTFSGNSAASDGGGMYNSHSSPSLNNVTFKNNTTPTVYGHWGGGMYNLLSSPTLTNVTFSGNSASMGGGMANFGSIIPSLTSVNYDSYPILTNVTFSGNTASNNGGGMYNSFSNPTVTNSILWGNTPDQLFNNFEDEYVTVTYSDIQGGFSGLGNIDADPLLGALADNGGFTQTHAIAAGSPAIDTGDPVTCPVIDQRGFVRPIDGDGIGLAICDMGAFEYDSFPAIYTLTLDVVGSGSIVANPEKNDYYYGEAVTLTAIADSDWVFYGWGGGCKQYGKPHHDNYF